MTPYEKRKEYEANLFARCLLMPEKMFINELNKIRKSGGNTKQMCVDKLAKIFNVESVNVADRLNDLKI